jgi:hypothetical protein
MLVPLQLVGAASIPSSSITLLVPCVAPKFVPMIVNCVPAAPRFGLRLTMLGGWTVDAPEGSAALGAVSARAAGAIARATRSNNGNAPRSRLGEFHLRR